MKKIIAIVALAASLSSNAFFNNWNNNGYNGYGYEDNGIFGYQTHMMLSSIHVGTLKRCQT